MFVLLLQTKAEKPKFITIYCVYQNMKKIIKICLFMKLTEKKLEWRKNGMISNNTKKTDSDIFFQRWLQYTTFI